MTYQVILTDRAARDLDEAYQWCAERAPEAAVGGQPVKSCRSRSESVVDLSDVHRYTYGWCV